MPFVPKNNFSVYLKTKFLLPCKSFLLCYGKVNLVSHSKQMKICADRYENMCWLVFSVWCRYYGLPQFWRISTFLHTPDTVLHTVYPIPYICTIYCHLSTLILSTSSRRQIKSQWRRNQYWMSIMWVWCIFLYPCLSLWCNLFYSIIFPGYVFQTMS